MAVDIEEGRGACRRQRSRVSPNVLLDHGGTKFAQRIDQRAVRETSGFTALCSQF